MAIHRKAIATRQAKMAAYAALLNGGTMEFKTTAVPADPATLSGVILATFTFANPAFSVVDGVATINAGTSNTQVDVGDIGHVVLRDSATNIVAVLDCGIGTEACVVDKVAVTAGEKVTIVSCTITEPM